MIHWTGKGYLGVVVPVVVFGIAEVIFSFTGKDDKDFPELAVLCCWALSSIVLWKIGFKLNKAHDEALGPATSKPEAWYRRRINHSIFYVPLEYWGLVLTAMYLSKYAFD